VFWLLGGHGDEPDHRQHEGHHAAGEGGRAQVDAPGALVADAAQDLRGLAVAATGQHGQQVDQHDRAADQSRAEIPRDRERGDGERDQHEPVAEQVRG
jgi:hypothetical protein